jgi:hypothetical protein
LFFPSFSVTATPNNGLMMADEEAMGLWMSFLGRLDWKGSDTMWKTRGTEGCGGTP